MYPLKSTTVTYVCSVNMTVRLNHFEFFIILKLSNFHFELSFNLSQAVVRDFSGEVTFHTSAPPLILSILPQQNLTIFFTGNVLNSPDSLKES
jgi:hypothetical protein